MVILEAPAVVKLSPEMWEAASWKRKVQGAVHLAHHGTLEGGSVLHHITVDDRDPASPCIRACVVYYQNSYSFGK